MSQPPLPTSPEPPVEAESGHHSNPLESSCCRSQPRDRDRPGCQAGSEEEAVQPVSNCAESILQERINSSTLEIRPQSLQSSRRLSNQKAACCCSSGGSTRISSPSNSTPLPAPKPPSQYPVHSKALLDCTVDSKYFSVTQTTVNEPSDPCFPPTQCLPSDDRKPASRDKEAQLLLDLLRSCKLKVK